MVAVSVEDDMMSRRHARLFFANDHWNIEDLGSHNGTYLNGKKIRNSLPVAVGNHLVLGSTSIVLLDPGSISVAPNSPRDEAEKEKTVFRLATELLEQDLIGGKNQAMSDETDLRRYAERLRILNEVHQALGRSIALDELLGLILDRVFDHLHPQQGAIFLKKTGDEYYCAASRSTIDSSGGIIASRNLIREVAEKQLAALVLDVQTDDRFSDASSMVNAGVRSLIAAPLLGPAGPLGMMVLSSKLAVRQFTEEDLKLLVSLASIAALRISNVALAEEAAERRHLQEEVSLARSIQLALLPNLLPSLDGYEIYGENSPSRGISGDLYQIIQRQDQRECTFWMADVCGKGIGAALLTASLEALSAGPIEEGWEPDEICRQISHLLFRRTSPEKYATAFIAVLETVTGFIRYCNAGHCPALLIRAQGVVEWLGPTGIPLGVLPNSEYSTEHATLAVGDTIILYTDGITEATNPKWEEYGAKRLADVCVQNQGVLPVQLARAIEADLERFAQGIPFADDRTMVIVRRHESYEQSIKG